MFELKKKNWIIKFRILITASSSSFEHRYLNFSFLVLKHNFPDDLSPHENTPFLETVHKIHHRCKMFPTTWYSSPPPFSKILIFFHEMSVPLDIASPFLFSTLLPSPLAMIFPSPIYNLIFFPVQPLDKLFFKLGNQLMIVLFCSFQKVSSLVFQFSLYIYDFFRGHFWTFFNAIFRAGIYWFQKHIYVNNKKNVQNRYISAKGRKGARP